MSASHIGVIRQAKSDDSPLALNPIHGSAGWQKIVSGQWIEMRYMNKCGCVGWFTLTEFDLQKEQIKENNRQKFLRLPYEERRRRMHPVPRQRHLMHA